MYSQDSFQTLSTTGQISVLALSAVMFALVCIVGFFAMRGQRGSVRIALAVFLFSLFVWLSPQVYYTLYGFFFEGLPRQLVIAAPPTFTQLLDLVTFTGLQTLSAHGQGVLFWSLVLLSWLMRPRATTAPDPDL